MLEKAEELEEINLEQEENSFTGDWIDDYVEATKTVPSPEIFRLWSAITAIAGALERKVWTSASAGNIYPTLFTLLVGPPASGKTNSIKIIRGIWAKVKDLNLAPDNVTKASLIDVLSRSLRNIIINNQLAYSFSSLSVASAEFGVFLPTHDLEFMNTLTHIYDNPDIYTEERRSTGVIEINKPSLNMLAATTAAYLGSILPEEAWEQGFTSRLIMIYADSTPKKDLFEKTTLNLTPLITTIKKIFLLNGNCVWSREAIEELNAWYNANCPPTPEHSKLLHYNGRRHIHAMKLSMISAVSRSQSLNVTIEDVERAKSWLIEAEKVMPDIFKSIGQKSDIQIITDMHFWAYKKWSTVAVNLRNPLTEDDLYKYLHSRVPSEKIPRLIDVALKTGYFKKGKYPTEYVPQPYNEITPIQ